MFKFAFLLLFFVSYNSGCFATEVTDCDRLYVLPWDEDSVVYQPLPNKRMIPQGAITACRKAVKWFPNERRFFLRLGILERNQDMLKKAASMGSGLATKVIEAINRQNQEFIAGIVGVDEDFADNKFPTDFLDYEFVLSRWGEPLPKEQPYPYPSESEAKYFPPYPDIWYRDVSQAEHVEVSRSYPLDNGDVMFRVNKRYEGYKGIQSSGGYIDFFSGKFRYLNFGQEHVLRQKKRDAFPFEHKGDMTHFRNQTGISHIRSTDRNWRDCFIYDDGVIYSKKFRHEDAKRVLVYIPSTPVRLENKYCNYKYKLNFHVNVNVVFLTPLFDNTTALSDGTFLARLAAFNFGVKDRFIATHIVRFDKNLNSPFIDNNPSLYSINWNKVIQPILDKSEEYEGMSKKEKVERIYDQIYEKVTGKKILH